MERPRDTTLDLVRVIGMLFIMFIHGPGSRDPDSDPEVYFFNSFLARGAVPVFFILSGYLGARRLNPGGLGFGDYAREKVRTLLVPLLLWNSLMLAGVFAVKLTGLHTRLRGQGAYFDNDLSFDAFTTDLIGIGWDPMVQDRVPIVYQFWFIRDLIVVSLLAFVIVRYLPKVPLLAWMLFFIPLPFAASLGFYLLGHQLAGVLRHENFPAPKETVAFSVAWILIGCAVTARWIELPFPVLQLGSAAFLFGLAILAGEGPTTARLAALGPTVFFVFATHEPLQMVLAKAWQATGLPGYGSLWFLILLALVTFSVCLMAYLVMRKFAPRLLAVATGGRA
ncbi:MAG: acyltransferase [Verrucomicrobiaceae bacterium]|nr:MAG: acyltransferase [Verrucomicrobiaceae bacterium]